MKGIKKEIEESEIKNFTYTGFTLDHWLDMVDILNSKTPNQPPSCYVTPKQILAIFGARFSDKQKDEISSLDQNRIYLFSF